MRKCSDVKAAAYICMGDDDRYPWWIAIAGALGKASLAQQCVGPNPTDRGKNGRKRSLLVDARGVPLSLVASGANVHDVKLLEPTLDAIVVERPEPDPGQPQNLCADAGSKGDPALQAAVARNDQPHIKQRKEEADAKRSQPGWKARRWVVERTHSWLNRYRKLLVSFEKTEASYVALPASAAALIFFQDILQFSWSV